MGTGRRVGGGGEGKGAGGARILRRGSGCAVTKLVDRSPTRPLSAPSGWMAIALMGTSTENDLCD